MQSGADDLRRLTDLPVSSNKEPVVVDGPSVDIRVTKRCLRENSSGASSSTDSSGRCQDPARQGAG